MKQKKYHVVYILTQLELGGAQKICLKLFNYFSPNSFLISSHKGILLEQVKNNPRFLAITSLQREVSIASLWNEILTFFSIYLFLIKLKNKQAFLIIHTHSSKAGILGRTAAYLAGINNIVHTVHGFGITPEQSKIAFYFFAFLEQIATFLTSTIICVSKHDQEIGGRLFWGFKQKSVIIRAAVNEQPFLAAKTKAKYLRTENIGQNRLILGSISCFKPQKNLLDLLKAFYLADKISEFNLNLEFTLEIIGDGIERKIIEQRIMRYNLQHKIKLLGWQQDVLSKMLHWNSFVLTSLWEGLPCSLIEALLLDQVAICYDTGGISEVLVDGKNGYLVNKFDVFTCAQKIQKLRLLTENSSLAKTNAEKTANFHLSTMFSRHEKVYAKFFI